MAQYKYPSPQVHTDLRLFFARENHTSCTAHLARFMKEGVPSQYQSVLFAVLFQRLKEPEGKVTPGEVASLLHVFRKLSENSLYAREPRRMVLANAEYMTGLVDKADLLSGSVLMQLLRSFTVTHPGAVALRAAPASEHAARCELAAHVADHVSNSQHVLLLSDAAQAMYLMTSSNVLLPGSVVRDLLHLLLDTLAVVKHGSDGVYRHVLSAILAFGWVPRAGHFLRDLWQAADRLKPTTVFRLAYVTAARAPASL